ncbi:unnamed protein product [Phytomonas sp. Hart1]|nr:unnamed protein product [Phytomonas sp. Hart1]|eukprot:CCW68221.1 unnamed protein product [Phytomonas sp. isolate Hart1]
MIQRQASDFTTGNPRLGVFFGPIQVAVVYPTFAILCWEAPRFIEKCSRSENVQWHYTTEWNGSHAHAAHPLSLSSDALHITIPLLYPGETVYVRLIAKGTLKNGTIALGSAKISFLASCTAPMPWLRPGALNSPLLFDALYMCSNDLIPMTFLKYRSDVSRIDDKGYCVLNTAVHCHKVHILYKKLQLPAESSSIYYLVVTSTAKKEGRREKLSTSALLETLCEEQAAVVFCGVGELGTIAAMSAYSVFAFLTPNTESGLVEGLGSRILCITYGTARRSFTHEPPLLHNAAHLSGNVLSYSNFAKRCDASAELSDVMSTASASFSSKEGEGTLLDVPLGIRVAPQLNPQLGCFRLSLEISNMDPVTDDEQLECLHIPHHLSLLCDLVLPCSSRGLLAPRIHSIRYRVIDMATLLLDIQGIHLHFNPLVTGVCCTNGFPLVMTMRNSSPSLITASVSMMQVVVQPGIFSADCAKPSGDGHLMVQVLVQTDLGIVETKTSVPIPIPVGMIELIRHAYDTKSAFSAWLTGLPSVFMDASVNCLLFIAGSSTCVMHRNNTLSLGDPLKQKLTNLTSAAELSSHYAHHQQQAEGGFMAFASAVASRFMRKPDPVVPGFFTLSPPFQFKGSDFISYILGVYSEGKATCMTEFLTRVSHWKMQIFHGLPHLSDQEYEMKLQRLLFMFHVMDVARDLPLVGLELLLYASVLQHLRSSDSNIGLVEDSVCPCFTETLSFEKFYELFYPLFLASDSLLGGIEAKIVCEVAHLWGICLFLELRYVQTLIHVVAVTGCHGSGRSTIINTLLSTLRNSKEAPNCKEVVLRQIDEDELELLQQIMRLGIPTTVFVVGELSDFTGTIFSSIVCTVRSSAKDHGQQKVHLVVSKVDEHLSCHVATMQAEFSSLNNCEEAEIFLAVRRVLDTVESSLLAHNDGPVSALSLLPSSVFIRSLFHCLGEHDICGEDRFASALVYFSRQTLLSALTEGLQPRASS